jgi:hypothetical protein
MAADPVSRGTSLLLIVVLVVAGYAAWQVAPLSRRMDALDRDRLETRDRLLRQIELLRDELGRARLIGSDPPPAAGAAPAAKSRPAAGTASPSPAVESTAAASPTAAPRVSRLNAETFLASRLLPEDATIAALLVENVPPQEVARRLRHSLAFVVAKGIQIEKQLARAPDTPPEILSALHAAVERAKAQP